MANRLSSERGTKVLVLEAGGRDWSPNIRIPAGVARMPRKYNWAYRGEPDQSRSGVIDTWSAGRVVGGSSSINGMLWVRGNRTDFDRWAALGCEGWDYEHVLPFYKQIETYESGANAYRGGNGPLHVSDLHVSHPSIEAFVAAAVEAGIDRNEDYNGAQQNGVGHLQFSHHRGQRDSAARAYLAPARRRSNLSVRIGAHVDRILFDDGRAIGVEYRRGGRRRQSFCRREVVLSAGAIASPKLLMLSGVGPADLLRHHGIDVVAESAGVGQGLQEHLFTIMTHLLNIPTLNRELTPWGVARHGLNFLLNGTGAATSSFAAAVVFDRPERGNGPPQFELLFAPYALADTEQTEAVTSGRASKVRHDIHDVTLATANTVTTLLCALETQARGSITLRSASPEAPPVIKHELAGRPEDIDALIAACRRTREIFAADAMRRLVIREQTPGDAVQTREQWERYLLATTFGGSHPVGTCRMGGDPASVVDPDLRVRGVSGLRVIDASVMPVISRGNTNAPTLVIAEKGADIMADIIGRKE